MKKYIFFLMCCLTIPARFLSAQDTAWIRKIICDLSSPDMYGRGYSYQGDRKAALYIEQLLKETGIPPLEESYFQPYQFPAFSMEGKVYMAVNKKELDPFDQYRIAPFSKSLREKNIPIIHADPMLFLQENKMSDFLQKYRNKLRSSLIYLDMTSISSERKEDGKLISRILEYISMQQNNPFLSKGFLIGVNELPSWGLSHTDYERSFAFIHVLASEITPKTKSADIEYTNRLMPHTTQNINAFLPGTVYPDSLIILTAHYDHLGSMGEAVIFPGAHDNASGTATVLGLARYFKEHPAPYSLVFCFFSGEEAGLRGSMHFIENLPVKAEQIKAVLNFDLLCGGDDGIMLVNGTEGKSAELFSRLKVLNEQYHYLPAVKARNNAPNSDHYPFTMKNIPALFLYTLGGKSGGYHQYTDTCDRCSLNAWENIFRVVTVWIEDLMKP